MVLKDFRQATKISLGRKLSCSKLLRVWVFLVTCFVSSFSASLFTAENKKSPQRNPLEYHIDLDRHHRLRLDWAVMYSKNTILLELSSAFTDNAEHHWLGFGFSSYGEPTNADLVMFWTDGRSKDHFQDTWTDAEGILHTDDEQNYELLDIRRRKGDVSLVFARHFDTCDDQDYKIEDGTTHIIFFWGAGELYSIEGLNISSMSIGLQRAQLLKPNLPVPSIPSNVKTFEIRHNKVHVPATETTYWCSTHRIPQLPVKHHIVKFEPYIEKASEGLVHHMEVFHCEVPVGTEIPRYNGLCMAMTKPQRLKSCKKVIGAWAMGAEAFVYPDEAGAPVGGRNFSPFVMLEIHYNNPDKLSNIVDSSGMKFTYTSQLRQYDAGCMELGLQYIDTMAIPPGLDEFYVSGYCVPQCTAEGLPQGGIKVFASQLHAHLTGRSIHTTHSRGGIQLDDLNHDDHYSPHFQEIRMLPKPVHVLPGDSLTTICKYRTADRTNVTMGGFAISDEMCVNYIHYYPRVDLQVCKSAIDTHTLQLYFDYLKLSDNMKTSRKKSYRDNYSAVDWKNENVQTLQELYDVGPLSVQCNRTNGQRFPGLWNGISPPKVILSLKESSSICDQIV